MAEAEDRWVPDGPLSFGDIFNRLFPIYRDHFLEILLPMLPFALLLGLINTARVFFMQEPMAKLQAALQQGGLPSGGSEIAAMVIIQLAAAVVYLLFYPMTQIAGITAADRAVKGDPLSLGEAWRRIKQLFWRWHISYFLVFLISLGPLLLFLIPALLTMQQNTTLSLGLAGFGMFAWGLAFMAIYYRVILVNPIASLGDFDPQGEFMADCVQIFKRAWYLSRGRAWKALGALLVLGLLVGFISFAFTLPVQLIGTAIAGLEGGEAAIWGGASLGQHPIVTGVQQASIMVLEVLVAPATAILYYLLWLDGRAEWEGYDLQVHLEVFSNRRERAESTESEETGDAAPEFQPDAL